MFSLVGQNCAILLVNLFHIIGVITMRKPPLCLATLKTQCIPLLKYVDLVFCPATVYLLSSASFRFQSGKYKE